MGSLNDDGVQPITTNVIYESNEKVKPSKVAIVQSVVSSVFVTPLNEIHEYMKVIPTHSGEAVG